MHQGPTPEKGQGNDTRYMHQKIRVLDQRVYQFANFKAEIGQKLDNFIALYYSKYNGRNYISC